jgi:hypothetical protein
VYSLVYGLAKDLKSASSGKDIDLLFASLFLLECILFYLV